MGWASPTKNWSIHNCQNGRHIYPGSHNPIWLSLCLCASGKLYIFYIILIWKVLCRNKIRFEKVIITILKSRAITNTYFRLLMPACCHRMTLKKFPTIHSNEVWELNTPDFVWCVMSTLRNGWQKITSECPRNLSSFVIFVLEVSIMTKMETKSEVSELTLTLMLMHCDIDFL